MAKEKPIVNFPDMNEVDPRPLDIEEVRKKAYPKV